MLKLSLDSYKAIENGVKPVFKIIVYFQSPEIYTEEDFLDSALPVRTGMSRDGYEIGNFTVRLKNISKYFSRKFTRELPNRRQVELRMNVGYEDIVVTSGIVNTWQYDLASNIVVLNVNATLLDTLKLRTTSVYSNPRDISVLSICIGDLSNSSFPCTAIDLDGYVHHASDFPMQSITQVCVDGEPKSAGFTAHTAWQDETGRSIACVIFDEPQYTKKVSVSGKGALKLDITSASAGELIENPADVIRFVMRDIQGYDETVLDNTELARIYADCLKEEIKAAFLLNAQMKTVKEFFDALARNIHAHWLLSDKKAIMRLRSAAVAGDVRYHFIEGNISRPTVTSEGLLNDVTINYAYDFAAGKHQAAIRKHNPLSKLVYGESAQIYDMQMVQSTRQAEKLADALLMTYSNPQLIVSIRHNYRSVYIEEGDLVQISHSYGIGENGFDAARALVVQKEVGDDIGYTLALEGSGALYQSDLVQLTQVSRSGGAGITVTYDQGVATITIYADVAGSPPVEGAEVTISGVKKVTDSRGQVRFNLLPGTYTAYITASGYKDAEINFSV